MKKTLCILIFSLTLFSCKEKNDNVNELVEVEITDNRLDLIKSEQSEVNDYMNKIISLNMEPDKQQIIIDELKSIHPKFFRNINIENLNKAQLQQLLKAINDTYKKELHLLTLKIKQEKLSEKKDSIMNTVNFK